MRTIELRPTAMGLFLLASTLFVAPAATPFPAVASEAPDPDRVPVRVVATLPVYASVVTAIGGAEVEVESIASPSEDAHFVRPRPSFAVAIRNADLFITTGLDLELWVPTLLDRAGNARVSEGGPGYVAAYGGVTLLDVPATVDRSGGDVHVFGNPHLHTDPLRMVQVARNITAGLVRVAPDRREFFQAGLDRFIAEVHNRLFGARLVETLGGPTLEQLALSGGLFDFLTANDLEGTPLVDLLGGWLGDGRVFRDQRIICYHKNWVYFEERFGVRCAEFVEAKPGIAPTPRHVARLVEMMTAESIEVVMGASYFGREKIESVASRGGATAIVAPMAPGAVEGVDDYFALVDRWVADLSGAFRAPAP